ncbi:hypothetical protein ACFV9C_01315 [Kribbella sp. NPDC059898]|uniref:hypothetical protein n=1 Tax=Kribbella sp. NPDC059898 TaxID=3346995 RepID=UPI00364A5728
MIARPADNSPEADRDISAQLPAKLREQMLQDPIFTRLGWGTDDHAEPDGDDGIGSGEQVVVHSSDTEEASVTPEHPVDDRQPAACGGVAGAAGAELTEIDQAVIDEPVVDPPREEPSDAVSDVETPGVKFADSDPDGSQDLSEQPSGDSSKTDDGDGDRTTHTEVDHADGIAQTRGLESETPADSVGQSRSNTGDVAIEEETLAQRLGRWDADRLNLPRPPFADQGDAVPDIDQRSADEANAVAYIAANKEQSPWLAPAADCEPAVQSIYASLDQGSGHAHVRHGPAVDSQALAARVARLEDPAQLDGNLRDRGVDGLDPTKMHYCGRYATAIVDARAFGAAIAMLSEHPDVQDALRSDWDGPKPDQLEIPISEVLGERGHEYCLGFRLVGDWNDARVQRKQWMLAKATGADLGALCEPRAEPIPTFEGGDIVVLFKRNHAASKFEISTTFPNPAES